MVGAAVKHDEGELHATLVSLVGVDAVVPDEEDGQVLHVDSSAEELHSVVKVERDLNMIHLRARPHSAEGDTVDLVVLANHRSAVPNSYVLKDTRVVIIDRTTVCATSGEALHSVATGAVDGGPSKNNQTSPEPLCRKQGLVHSRREGDRSGCRTSCNNHRVLLDDDSRRPLRTRSKSVGGLPVAVDGGASLNCEGDAGRHEELGGQKDRCRRAPSGIGVQGPARNHRVRCRQVPRNPPLVRQPRPA
mmetsp:Transcript_15394/g.58565  ORF Transcript_15394/g.58565 Transcript_15394/m.58565 type:complete len:247 (-) Transcript_15394:703-1443(-)